MLLMHAFFACAGLPPAPEGDWSWSVDRGALPAAEMTVYLVGSGEMGAGLAFSGELPEGYGPEPLHLEGYAYVIDHPTAGRVVIDPGYGRRTAEDPHDVPGRAIARSTNLEMGAPLVDLLAGQAAVDHILVTHMHVDHSGGIEDFPDALVHIDPAEWDFGTSRRRMTRATVPPLDHGQIQVEPLTFDDGPCGPFPRSQDVFDDGSLIALSTPGHTPGHTGFLINLPGGSFLLTGDSAWFDPHWREPAGKGGASRLIEPDWRGAADANWRIRAMAQRHPEIVVLSGHDPANLERITPGTVYR